MYKCPFCEFEYSDRSDLEQHLLEHHFLSMKSYYEMEPLRSDEGRCYKCGMYRPPLSYINHEDYYLPCWKCMKNYYERKQSVAMIQAAITDYYSKVQSDRYLQMFLINNIYFESTLDHTYQGFKDVLKLLYKHDRNKVWFLDWIKGFPRVISKENLLGIKAVLVDDHYNIVGGKKSISINFWEVKFPEIIPFDQRHHSRYNIFNPSTDSRNTKRLRLKNEADECIKFYNNENDDSVKSLFRIINTHTGEVIDPHSLSPQDLQVTKLIILRNKSFTRLICNMVNEVIRNSRCFSDSVFLKNSLIINPDKKINVNLSWLPEEKRENYINISIL